MMDMPKGLRGADLALLVALDVLLEECNVTRAAARLNMSQPALSAQLARLRQLVGDPLLIPAEGGRGMTPTARGLAIRAPLRAALRELNAVLQNGSVFSPETDRRTFQIGASDNGFVMVGLDLMRRVTEAAPGVRLGFRSLPGELAAELLERGDVDLMIAADFAIPRAMKRRALVNDRYVMAQRKGHPRGRMPPDLEQYRALRHLIVSGDGGGFHGFMDDSLRELGLTRDVVISVQQYHLAPLVLEATDLVCVLPERFLRRFADKLDLLTLPVEVQGFALSAAWHPRLHADPAHRWLRDQLIDIAEAREDMCDPQPGFGIR